MHAKTLFLKTGAGVLVFLFCLALPAFAVITNRGNEAVMIEIRKESGFSHRVNLFPGQTIEIPSDAREVAIIPRTAGPRGDESIRVDIVEKSGKVAVLKKFGESHILGKDEDIFGAKTERRSGRVVNRGNIAVDLEITQEEGLSQMRSLYLGESISLSKDTKKVQVLSNRSFRGDEIVRVEVTLPTGKKHLISALGGIVETEDEDPLI